MIRTLTAAAALLAASVLSAQTPFLVTDLNTTAMDAVSSDPISFTAYGGRVVFQARTDATGHELWQTSADQTTLVRDILPGGLGSITFPAPFAATPNGVVFAAFTDENGRELWKTDGTAEGTVRLADICPSTCSSSPTLLAVFGNLVLFTANNGADGSEPWVTDGTAAGTRLLANLDGTAASTTLNGVAIGSDRAFLFARNSVWVTDGTPEGTTTSDVSIVNPRGVSAIGRTAYFFMTTPETGYELWKTDGTVAGTAMVTEIVPGSGSALSNASRTMAYNGKVYFLVLTGSNTTDLWSSDGTAAGTQLVKAAIPSTTVPVLRTRGSLLYIETSDSLWRSDGTSGGTSVLAPFRVSSLTAAFSGVAFVRVNAGVYELWKSDGTQAPTLITTVAATSLEFLSYAGGKLYFSARSDAGTEPWVSDGTAAGTRMLANIAVDPAASSEPSSLTAAGDLVFFEATTSLSTRRFLRSDGTADGTIALANTDAYSRFTPWNGSLFFKSDPATLWKTDGTAAGTTLVKTLTSSSYGAPSIDLLFPSSSWLFFAGSEDYGLFPWRTDGTTAGTIQLGAATSADVPPTPPRSFAELAGRVYTHAYGNGLFLLGSTAAATNRVVPLDSGDDITTPLVTGAGALVFGRTTAAHGTELWKSDGTVDGTVLIKDIRTGSASSQPESLVAAGRYVYFIADDGVHGREVWRTDGTEAGTILLADIVVNGGTAFPLELKAVGELVYFTAATSSTRELWRSDGTPDGTRKVADLGVDQGSWPLYPVGDVLYFPADDGTHGRELWKTTGIDTIAMVADLEPGAGSSSPAEVVRAGNLIYFAATTIGTGRELWALPVTGAGLTTISIGDLRINEGQGGTVVVTRGGDTTGSSTVAFTTSDATAQAGTDYTAASGSIVFAAGETTKTIAIASLSDATIENDESFFVTLASATGAIITRGTATIAVNDDDRAADLSIEFTGARSVRVTNAGPSTATGVVLRYSESPGRKPSELTPCEEGKLPFDCVMDPIAAGASATFELDASREGYTDPVRPPGSTIHVAVRATELDANPADNSIARMIGGENGIMIALAPFLTVGTPAVVHVQLPFAMPADTTLTLTSSNTSVAQSPASVVVPQGQSTAQFTITPLASGTTVLTVDCIYGRAAIHVTVVDPGATAKLDVAIVTSDAIVFAGEAAVVTARVSALLPDGTLPAGSMSLVDASGNIIETKALDANASASFTRNGLTPGTHWHTFRYSGDVNFHALEGADGFVQVKRWVTETDVQLPPMVCTTADITVVVRNRTTTAAPTGAVEISVQNRIVATVPLQATGVEGEARAVYSHTFAAGDSYVTVAYQPSGAFASSSDSASFQMSNCTPMNLRATAIAPTQVQVTWNATGAHHYEVLRSSSQSVWTVVATTAGASFLDTGVSANKAYLYIVRALDASNALLSQAPPDLATTVMFTDDPLVARGPFIRGTHFSEVEIATIVVESFGSNAFLAPTMGTTPGSRVRSTHITDLRSRINGARGRLGLSAHPFTGAASPGTMIRAQHLQELRDAVK